MLQLFQSLAPKREQYFQSARHRCACVVLLAMNHRTRFKLATGMRVCRNAKRAWTEQGKEKRHADRWPFRDTRSQRKRRIPNWHSARRAGHQPAIKPHVVVSGDVGAGAARRKEPPPDSRRAATCRGVFPVAPRESTASAPISDIHPQLHFPSTLISPLAINQWCNFSSTAPRPAPVSDQVKSLFCTIASD